MSQRTTVDDPDELELARMISVRLQQGRLARSQFEQVSQRGIGTGSDLAGDDDATARMNLSHVVRSALMMVTDNTRALEGLLRPGGRLVVPLYAHYPVLRSVLEASALAKWILLPDIRRDRIERLLRAQLSDVRQDSALAKVELTAVESLDEPPASSVLEQQRTINDRRRSRDMEMIQKIAADQDITWTAIKDGLPPWGGIVRAVCTLPRGIARHSSARGVRREHLEDDEWSLSPFSEQDSPPFRSRRTDQAFARHCERQSDRIAGVNPWSSAGRR